MHNIHKSINSNVKGGNMISCSLMFRKCSVKIKILIISYYLNLFIQCTQKKLHQISHGMGKGPGMEVSMFPKENSTESGGF